MKHTSLVFIVGAVACSSAFIFAACSSDDSTTPAGTGGSTGGSAGMAGVAGNAGGTAGQAGKGGTAGGGQGGTAGGGQGGTAGGGQGGTGGASNNKTGILMVGQTAGKMSGTAFGSYFAAANFTDTAATPTTDCTNTTVGACTVTACKSTTGPDGGGVDGGTPKAPTAGAIAITGGVEPIALTADATTGLYAAASGTKALFTGGETLTFDAKGADVPAFNGTLTAPKTPVLSAPAMPTGIGGALEITLATPPTFTWTNGDSKVIISLSDGDKATLHAAICTFDGAAGTGAIPADAVKDFVKGNATAYFSVSSMITKDVTAGDWKVMLQTTVTGNDATGAMTSGMASFK